MKPVESPKEKLMLAAIRQIEEHGPSHVTVRKIAADAEMNVASINYHFGSKSQLIEFALSSSISHMMEDIEVFIDRIGDAGFTATFCEILGYMLEGGLRYPNLTKAHLDAPFRKSDFSGPFPERFRPLLGRFVELLLQEAPELTRPQATQRVVSAVSAILFPVCFLELFPTGWSENATLRQQYVAGLAAGLTR